MDKQHGKKMQDQSIDFRHSIKNMKTKIAMEQQ